MVLFVSHLPHANRTRLCCYITEHLSKELITHKLPYYEQTRDYQVIAKITTGNLPTWPAEEGIAGGMGHRAREELQDICKLCWVGNPGDRPAVKALGLYFNSRIPAGRKVRHGSPS